MEAGIQTGHLPIRYLGLPLTTKLMTKHDYEPLVDKVRNRFLSWTNRSLSYAGRLQLIKTVIGSTVNFLSSVFILPKGCYDTIERMCAAFLWSGSPLDSHKAKITWDEVCLPMAEGGLGVRKLRESARVFALNLIWRLLTLAGSLWVAWIDTYLLKHKPLWTIKVGSNGSWIWRKLLKIRDHAYSFIRYEVNDGKTVFFCHDNWIGNGNLIEVLGNAGPTVFGIPINATVRQALMVPRWRQSSSLRRRYPELVDKLASISQSEDSGGDIPLWKHDESDFRNSFSSVKTWELTSVRKDNVGWARIIWFAQRIPRCSFITWIAIRNRLSTGARMRSWGITQPCVFCGDPNETRSHLFFSCPLSTVIWKRASNGLKPYSSSTTWTSVLNSLASGGFATLDYILIRLVFQVTLYTIWRERNTRRNNGRASTAPQLFKVVERLVRNRISSLDYKHSHRLAGLRCRWFETQAL